MPYPDRRRPVSAVGAGAPGLLSRLVGLVVGAVVLAGALVVSAMLAAVLLAVAAAAGAWMWWRTRDLRRSLREAAASRAAAGGSFEAGAGRANRDATVIEGDFIREIPDRARPDGSRRDGTLPDRD